MKKAKKKPDIEWFAPKRKKAIANSTRAASDLIVLLSQGHETIQDVFDAIRFDMEAKSVLEKYISMGYGGQTAREWFRA